ncbi:MAG: aldo/keto reductase, partial [Chloroflexota bacterium]
TDKIAKNKYDKTVDKDLLIVQRCAELSDKYGVSRAQIALAWLLQKENISAPIIGATKISHLEEAAGALTVKLSDDDKKYLEELYEPHSVIGAL